MPIVFREDLYFKSLSHLANRITKASPNLLKHVQGITLHVFNESLSSMTLSRPTFPVAEKDHGKPDTAEWWEARYAEQFEPPDVPPMLPFSFREAARSKIFKANRFPAKEKDHTSTIALTWDALTRIGELKKIWILLKDQGGTEGARYDVEQRLVLNMVAAACPKIQEFTSFSNLLPLDYLQDFHDLRLLRFSGYSRSTPTETLDILRASKYLDSIIVYRYLEYNDKDHAIVTAKLPQYLSFTPDVLSKVRPLKRFEISHMTSSAPSEHVTVPVLKALRAHIESLRTFSITSDLPINGDYLQELISFIASSNLTNLLVQITVPKKLESLIDNEMVFPKKTRHRKSKLTESGQSSPGREFVQYYMQAST